MFIVIFLCEVAMQVQVEKPTVEADQSQAAAQQRISPTKPPASLSERFNFWLLRWIKLIARWQQ